MVVYFFGTCFFLFFLFIIYFLAEFLVAANRFTERRLNKYGFPCKRSTEGLALYERVFKRVLSGFLAWSLPRKTFFEVTPVSFPCSIFDVFKNCYQWKGLSKWSVEFALNFSIGFLPFLEKTSSAVTVAVNQANDISIILAWHVMPVIYCKWIFAEIF